MTVVSLFQIGNYKVEPPGLFRGRGEHPKVLFCMHVFIKELAILGLGGPFINQFMT